MDELFVVETMPERVKYRPGDEISYEGISFSLDGVEVPLDLVFFSVPEGETWKRGDKSLDVVASYIDYEVVFTLKRKRNPLLLLLLLLLAALIAVSAALLSTGPLDPDDETDGDRGSHLIPPEDMTEEEIVEMLNRLAELSTITVSLDPEPELVDGKVHLRFVVEEPNNGFSERMELVQDGKVVGHSEIVSPGDWVEWISAPDAVPGAAIAIVYAVDEDGNDSGSPVNVEIQITEAGQAELPASSTSGPVSEAVAGPVVEPMPAVESVPVSEPEPAPVVEPVPAAEPAPAVYDLGASFVGWEVPASGIVDYQGLGWFMCHSNTWQGGVVSSLCPGDVVMVDGAAYTVAGVTRAGVGESVADWRYAYEDYKLFSTCIEDGSNDVWIVYAS